MNILSLDSLSYGVYVVTTWNEGVPTGCVVNSVMQISATPAVIAISVNNDNLTKEVIDKSGVFAVNVLGKNVKPTTIGTFGFRSGRDFNKFAETEPKLLGYMPILPEALSYICCKVINKVENFTHTVYFGEVTDGDILKNEEPLTYAYYKNVIKGTTHKNAPTYKEKSKGE